MSGILHHFARLSEVTLHYTTCGDPSAPALLLLHGYPQTRFDSVGFRIARTLTP